MAIAPIMLSTLTTFDQANADFYKEVLAEGLDVLNMSFGYPGPIELYEDLRGHSVAAVATGEDGEIVRFSNRCGLAANWCIAAPGLRVWAAYFGPYRGDIIRGYVPASGTSFAAPTGTRLRSGDSRGGSMGPGLRLGLGETPGGVDIGHARLAQDAITLSVDWPDGVIATAFTTEADRNAKPVSGALIS